MGLEGQGKARKRQSKVEKEGRRKDSKRRENRIWNEEDNGKE